MAKSSPHDYHYRLISRLQSCCEIFFWLIFILSLASVILPQVNNDQRITVAIDIANIICILLFFILEFVADYILLPMAEDRRRSDFIDNSFNSKILSANSINYYDNDEVSHGLYKVAVNLFENIFFTYSLCKVLTWRKIILPVVLLLGILMVAYYGFRNVPFALTLLQLFFSAQILGNLLKHIVLLTSLHTIQDKIIALFGQSDFRVRIQEHQASVYHCWVTYEALITKINPGVPDQIFKARNDVLTREWQELKKRFHIS